MPVPAVTPTLSRCSQLGGAVAYVTAPAHERSEVPLVGTCVCRRLSRSGKQQPGRRKHPRRLEARRCQHRQPGDGRAIELGTLVDMDGWVSGSCVRCALQLNMQEQHPSYSTTAQGRFSQFRRANNLQGASTKIIFMLIHICDAPPGDTPTSDHGTNRISDGKPWHV